MEFERKLPTGEFRIPRVIFQVQPYQSISSKKTQALTKPSTNNKDESRKVEEAKNESLLEVKVDRTTELIKSLIDIKEMEKYLNSQSRKFLEDFELNNYLGRGSSGIVYEGKPKCNNKQRVAYKFCITAEEDAKNEEYKEKLKRRDQQRFKETALLKKLHHENIINLYGHLKINETSSCLVLGFAKYGDLTHFRTKLVKRKTLSESTLCYFSKGILEAIEYFHMQKIIHMDIKEDNILIDDQLNPKISDFSVSLTYEKFTPDKKFKIPFAGTGFYVSPEIIDGTPINYHDCSKIDIYSFGIILYHLAYGDFPYNLSEIKGKGKEKNDFNEISKQVKNNPLIFPENKKSKQFQNFLEGLLNKNIEKRFDVNKALQHEWIKNADILIEEKEKFGNLEKFLVTLLSDGFLQFNNKLNI